MGWKEWKADEAHTCVLCSLVWAGFPVAPEGFYAVLGQLARWFYPFGSGGHCNNNYYYLLRSS